MVRMVIYLGFLPKSQIMKVSKLLLHPLFYVHSTPFNSLLLVSYFAFLGFLQDKQNTQRKPKCVKCAHGWAGWNPPQQEKKQYLLEMGVKFVWKLSMWLPGELATPVRREGYKLREGLVSKGQIRSYKQVFKTTFWGRLSW